MPALGDSLAKMSGKTVIVIGDVMLDVFCYGEITRISPEAPVPVVRVSSQETFIGGAANTANNISSMGGKAALLGVLGSDDAGKRLCQMIRQKGIGAKGILIDTKRPTTVKTRILAQGKQLLRYDIENSSQISKRQEEELLDNFKGAIKNADAVVISDYAKGTVTPELANRIISTSSKAGVPVLIDSKHYFNFNLANATLLKPNMKELAKETGLDVSGEAGLKKALAMMDEKLHPKYIVVTLGERGMLVYHDAKITTIPAVKIDALDVSGAGDTVISALSLALAAGLPIVTAASIANYAAACAVQKKGTLPSSIAEIRKLMECRK